ncbi:hypothetical protein M422DRAFT_210774, partial [Sphaerobolus stellatus SS14]
MWIEFGFCIFRHEEEEMRFGGLYINLLRICSFEEVHEAYRSRTLFTLLVSKGLEPELRRLWPWKADQEIRRLQAFLAEEFRRSVWDLKHFVLYGDEKYEGIPAIYVDYGFMNCKSQEETQELKDVYKTYLLKGDTDPVDLHNAAIKGKIFEHVAKFVKLRKRFKKLMVNPYPL